MLVLSRHVGEEILIAGDIRIKVVAIRGSSVSIGIEAPRSLPVMRHELLAEGCAAVPNTTFRCRANGAHSSMNGAP